MHEMRIYKKSKNLSLVGVLKMEYMEEHGKDLTEVVRCKSCKFSKWADKNKQRYCQRKWVMYKVRERDYCSYGIRNKE